MQATFLDTQGTVYLAFATRGQLFEDNNTERQIERALACFKESLSLIEELSDEHRIGERNNEKLARLHKEQADLALAILRGK